MEKKINYNQRVSNTLLKNYTEQCEILQMISIPYIGIYDSEYIFMNPIICFCNNNVPKNFPQPIESKISNVLNRYSKISFQYYHITLDASPIYNKINQRTIECNEVRLNVVPHPFIFRNLSGKLKADYQVSVYASLFKNNNDFNVINETEEKDRIIVNPKNELNNKENEREIILHRTKENLAAISPNNLSFLINLNCQLIHFYIVLFGVSRGKISLGCCCEYVIMPNAFNSKLFMEMNLSFMNAKSTENILKNIYLSKMIYNDNFKNILEYFLFEIITKIQENLKNNILNNNTIIKDFMIKAFDNIFDFGDNGDIDLKSHNIDINNVSEFYYNYFLNFVSKLFNGDNLQIQNYAEDIIDYSINNYYIIEIIKKFINFHLSTTNEIFSSYENYLQYFNFFDSIKEKSRVEYINNIWPASKEFVCSFLGISVDEFEKKTKAITSKDKKPNKNIEEFYNISNNLLNNGTITKEEMDKIDLPFLNYLYYIIWHSKGKIKGVHKNFGKLSFFQDNLISVCYHCENDERYELLINIAQQLEKADNKYLKIEGL